MQIAKEGHEVALQGGQGIEVNSTYVEVAIITCKDVRDGQRVSSLVKSALSVKPVIIFILVLPVVSRGISTMRCVC